MAITKLVITGNTTAVGLSSDPLTISLVERTPANLVSVAPDDNITATDVQDALEQLDDIKAPIASPSFTGNVGIGTTSPSELLHVTGASTAKVQISSTTSTGITGIHFGDPDDVNSGRVQYEHNTDHMGLYTNNTEKVRINSSGNVGIGTTSPSTNLHIAAGNSGTDVDILRVSGTNSAFNVTCSDLSINNPVWTLRTFTGEALAFGDGTDENMRIDASGNVGIGTDSPATDLHIKNTSAAQLLIESGETATGFLLFGDASDLNIGSVSYDHSDNSMRFETDDTERMRIDSSGVVNVYNGIDFGGAVNSGGTVSSSNKLDDYEEGTWTPVASGYGGTMTVNSAAYTKIGRLVHLRASVTFSNTSDGSIIQITGLPFAQGTANTGRGGSVTRDTSGSVAFTDGSASTILRMLSNTHSTVNYTAVKEATVEFFHIYDA